MSPDRDILRIEEHGDYCVLDAQDAADQEQTRVIVRDGHRRDVAQAVAGDDYRVIPANAPHGCHLSADPDEPCPVCGNKVPQWERELLAAQPDRPEPVDPAIIAQAKAEALREFADGVRFPNDWILFQRHDDSSGVTVPDLLRETAARYEREAEPEPDEAAVEALAALLEATWAAGGMGAAEQARLLIRRGVYVEVPAATRGGRP